jgi:hypothetical protein
MSRVDEKERWGRIQAGKVAQSLLSSKECNALQMSNVWFEYRKDFFENE